MLDIRTAIIEDLPRIIEIFSHARRFIAEHGNPDQWGPDNWPPEDLIRSDIESGKSHVCIYNGEIVGTFICDQGKNIEPDYLKIDDGTWLDDSIYGVIHRIASGGKIKGIGSACIHWVLSRCRHLRIDTHKNNLVMQNMLRKNGFVHCGTIYVRNGSKPRMAFKRTGIK